MNASDARIMSNENLPKLIESNVLAAKATMNQSIAQAAKDGEFKAGLRINLPVKIQSDVISQLESHFKSLGYDVQVFDLFISKMIQVSWSQE